MSKKLKDALLLMCPFQQHPEKIIKCIGDFCMAWEWESQPIWEWKASPDNSSDSWNSTAIKKEIPEASSVEEARLNHWTGDCKMMMQRLYLPFEQR